MKKTNERGNKQNSFIVLIILVILCLAYIFASKSIIKRNLTFLKLDESLGNDIYTTSMDYSNIYNKQVQDDIENEINYLISNKNTFKKPLIIYNPYGTNKLALNIYFHDKENLDFSYEILNNSGRFSKKIHINKQSDLYKFQIIGLEAGTKNKITIFSSNNKTFSFEIDVPNYDLPLTNVTVSEKNTSSKLSEGFYAYLGMMNNGKVDDLYLVDNYGIVRAIIPLKGNEYSTENSTADNIIIYDNYMFYNISSNQIAKVSNLGKVEEIYSFDGYKKHHDFVIDDKNNKLIALVSQNDSSTMEDIVLVYDLINNKYSTIDLKSILSEIYLKSNTPYYNDYTKGKVDWIHLNSIDIIDEQLLLSSRELSSIICLSDIYTNPKLSYILGDKEMYKNTSYVDFVYEQKNDFYMHLGQHTAYFYNDKEHIALYNNNYGQSQAISWFDWESHYNPKMENSSFFYLYNIDNTDKTYELVSQIEVPYSALMSSAQILDNQNKVIFSRAECVYAEYNNNNNLIAEFSIDRFSYRVNKYDFYNFWFD